MAGKRAPDALAADQVDNLAQVLAGVRTGGLHTRPELVRELGLGRNVVSQRVGQLVELGLLDEAGWPRRPAAGRHGSCASGRRPAACWWPSWVRPTCRWG